MLIAVGCLTLLALASLALNAYLLRAQREERAQHALERRDLLERIQRPEHVPLAPSAPLVYPEPELDEIDLVGRIADDPGEGVMPTYAT